jgi:Zn-dependent protease with chaperone function
MVRERTAAFGSVTRFSTHVLGAAACTAGAVLVAGENPWNVPLLGVLIALAAPLGPIVRELLDAERGVPAPVDLQQMADGLATRMSIKPVPVGVTVDQPGVAALRGLTRRTRRIVIGEPELSLPTARLLAILAHEFAHAKAHHQAKGLLLSVLTWVLPQAACGTAVPLLGGGSAAVVVAAVSAGALTGVCVLALYALMRRQEHEADRTATTLAGVWVSEQLAAHFCDHDARHTHGSVYSTHPAPAARAARLANNI